MRLLAVGAAMIYGSVCSGIEAATVAWHPLGWRAAFYSEIEKFPRAVLQHHYPDVPLHGDFTTIEAGQYEPIDLLVGGTPCQSFSVAGLRGGLADDRGNLALEFLRLAQRLRPRWLVWENVPGVLSSNGGRDFGSILGGMVELGYGVAYRILDAQHFGVPQRRRRVFVVGHLGDWRRAAAVLFERHSLSGNPPPRRETRERVAPTISARTKGGGGLGTDFDCDGGLIAHALDSFSAGRCTEDGTGRGVPLTTRSLRADDFDASEDGTGRGTPLVMAFSGESDGSTARNASDIARPITNRHGDPGFIAFSAKDHGGDAGELSPTLRAGGFAKSHANAGVMPAVAFAQNSRDELREMHVAGALAAEPGMKQQSYARQGMTVCRLTPRECERLQGFPDNYTNIPGYNPRYTGPFGGNRGVADGPRYKALGNSMAVPCMRWIGERIAMVEALAHQEAAA